MGINLKDYINYDIDSWLTEEEAERLFVAAGYVKISDHEPDDPVYRDCNGTVIVDGSKIVYQIGSAWEVTGHVKMKDDELWVFWDDGFQSLSMKIFWFSEVDEKITKVLGNIYE